MLPLRRRALDVLIDRAAVSEAGGEIDRQTHNRSRQTHFHKPCECLLDRGSTVCACIPGRWFSLGYALLACTRSFVPTCARCTESAVTGEIERALPTVPSTMVQLQESYATGTTSRQPARPPFGTFPPHPPNRNECGSNEPTTRGPGGREFILTLVSLGLSRHARRARRAGRDTTCADLSVRSSATSRYRDSSLR